MSAGNYVCAGVDTYCTLMSKFIDTMPGFFDDEQLKQMMAESINSFLFSFGTGINYKSKKLSKNHVKKFLESNETVITRPFMSETKMLWDSGGFQIANGALYTKDMPGFIDLYYNLIAGHKDKYTNAFILDLPPGPGSADIFENYEQVEDINRLSYQKAAALPQDVKDKIIYIHHFRSPALYDTWMKFLDEGLADGYNYFGTGGIVASMSTDTKIPIIIYAVPLTSILNYALKKGIKEFKFHVLGGANFRDVFCHKLFEHHVKVVHDIDLTITYDSSAIFKGLAIGRYVQVLDSHGNIMKMDLRSSALPMRFMDQNITNEDNVYRICNDLAEKYGLTKLNKVDHPIYCPTTGTLNRIVHMYLICHIFKMYRTVEQMSEDMVQKVYPIWQSDPGEFNKQCTDFTAKLNQGKRSAKLKAKSALWTSLDFLTKLDEEKARDIVVKFMDGDDIQFKSNSTIDSLTEETPLRSQPKQKRITSDNICSFED